MLEKQIFISHSSRDKKFAKKLYDDLLWEGYPVWMDISDLEEAKEWKPQLEYHLRKSDRFIVLISSQSVDSKWVCHEGSMAYALDQLIIPIRIEGSETCPSACHPIWVQPTQLFDFIEGEIDYQDQYKKLKQRLGAPFPIQKYAEQSLILYTTSGGLLDEVALNLIEKHFNDIAWRGKEALAKELIEKSKRKLMDPWTRYDQLAKDYENAKTDISNLSRRDKIHRNLFVFFYILLAIYWFVVVLSQFR